MYHLEGGSPPGILGDPEKRLEYWRAILAHGIEPPRLDCELGAKAIDGIFTGIEVGLKGSSVAAKNVAWQEIMAALNRRTCVTNEQYNMLIKAGQYSPLFRFTE